MPYPNPATWGLFPAGSGRHMNQRHKKQRRSQGRDAAQHEGPNIAIVLVNGPTAQNRGGDGTDS